MPSGPTRKILGLLGSAAKATGDAIKTRLEIVEAPAPTPVIAALPAAPSEPEVERVAAPEAAIELTQEQVDAIMAAQPGEPPTLPDILICPVAPIIVVCAICESLVDRRKKMLIYAAQSDEEDAETQPLCPSCGTDVKLLKRHRYVRIRGFADATGISVVKVKSSESDKFNDMRVQGYC